MQDRFYVGHVIVVVVWAEKNGGFLEVNILARPLRVGSEAIKDRVGFRGGGFGKKHKIICKKKVGNAGRISGNFNPVDRTKIFSLDDKPRKGFRAKNKKERG
jgi:hypothetical protein